MSFQGQLGGAPLLFLGRGAGLGSVVSPVDGVGPPGQWRSIGVAGAQVMDVPQQVGPAALLGAIIMVVGSVAIADQYSGESIVQGFIHHRLAPAPPQEVAFGGGAESPHVAVGPALTPAGFVGPVSSARFRRPGFVGPVSSARFRRRGPLGWPGRGPVCRLPSAGPLAPSDEWPRRWRPR